MCKVFHTLKKSKGKWQMLKREEAEGRENTFIRNSSSKSRWERGEGGCGKGIPTTLDAWWQQGNNDNSHDNDDDNDCNGAEKQQLKALTRPETTRQLQGQQPPLPAPLTPPVWAVVSFAAFRMQMLATCDKMMQSQECNKLLPQCTQMMKQLHLCFKNNFTQYAKYPLYVWMATPRESGSKKKNFFNKKKNKNQNYCEN